MRVVLDAAADASQQVVMRFSSQWAAMGADECSVWTAVAEDATAKYIEALAMFRSGPGSEEPRRPMNAN
jgi:hypothetical protein